MTRAATSLHGARFMALTGLLVLAIAASASEAGAETDADFQAYCRANYPNSAHQLIGLTHYCRQVGSGGATRQGVDYSEACRLTTGSTSFRRIGSRVICADQAGAAAGGTTDEPLDLQAYCREKFPNSAYERRNERWGIAHYCRRPGATGGFTLQPIDLGDACRVTGGGNAYETTGGSVMCSGSVGSTTAGPGPQPGPGPRPGPGPGPGPGPFPPGPPPGPQANPQPLPFPPPAPIPEQPQPGGPQPAAASGDADAQIALACQSAFGGKWRDGTLPLVEEIRSQMQAGISERLPECEEGTGYMGLERNDACFVAVLAGEPAKAWLRILDIYQCHVYFIGLSETATPQQIRTAREEACLIEEVLDELAQQADEHGAAVQANDIRPLQKESAGVDDLCAKGEVRFVDAVTLETFSDSEPMPYFTPMFVEVEFDRDMEKPARKVNIEVGGSVHEFQVGKVSSRLYRSEQPFLIEPERAVEP